MDGVAARKEGQRAGSMASDAERAKNGPSGKLGATNTPTEVSVDMRAAFASSRRNEREGSKRNAAKNPSNGGAGRVRWQSRLGKSPCDSESDDSDFEEDETTLRDKNLFVAYVLQHRLSISLFVLGLILLAIGVVLVELVPFLVDVGHVVSFVGVVFLGGLLGDLTVRLVMFFIEASIRCTSSRAQRYTLTVVIFYLSGSRVALARTIHCIIVVLTAFVLRALSVPGTPWATAYMWLIRVFGLLALLFFGRAAATTIRSYLAQDFGTRSHQIRLKESLDDQELLNTLRKIEDPFFTALNEQRQVMESSEESLHPEDWQRLIRYINTTQVSGQRPPGSDKHQPAKPGADDGLAQISRPIASKLFRRMYGIVNARRALAQAKENALAKAAALAERDSREGLQVDPAPIRRVGSDTNLLGASQLHRAETKQQKDQSKSDRAQSALDLEQGASAGLRGAGDLLIASKAVEERHSEARVAQTALLRAFEAPQQRDGSGLQANGTSAADQQVNPAASIRPRMSSRGFLRRRGLAAAKAPRTNSGDVEDESSRRQTAERGPGFGSWTDQDTISVMRSSRSSTDRRRIYKEEMIEVLEQLYGESLDPVRVWDETLDPRKAGYVSYGRFKRTIESMFRRRYKLSLTLQDAQVVIKSIDTALMSVVVVIVVLVSLALFSQDSVQLFASMATAILAWSFVFGSTVASSFENIIYLFAVHPYDVGDMIKLGEDRYEVLRIRLLCTDLLKADGAFVRLENKRIPGMGQLFNYSTSQNHGNGFNIYIPAADVTAKLVADIRADVKQALQSKVGSVVDSFTFTARDLVHPFDRGVDMQQPGERAALLYPTHVRFFLWISFLFPNKSLGNTFAEQSELLIAIAGVMQRHGLAPPLFAKSDKLLTPRLSSESFSNSHSPKFAGDPALSPSKQAMSPLLATAGMSIPPLSLGSSALARTGLFSMGAQVPAAEAASPPLPPAEKKSQ